MKKTGHHVIIVNGDGNKITLGESKSHFFTALVIAFGVFAGAVVLAVSRCCPELLADFVRFIISVAVGS